MYEHDWEKLHIDHFWELMISNEAVTTLATVTNSSHFPSYSYSESDCSFQQELPKPPSQSDTLKEVKRDSPEVLFYKVAKEPGSELYYFKSYLKDKQRILGFDPEGNPMNTSQVQPKQQESLFSVV